MCNSNASVYVHMSLCTHPGSSPTQDQTKNSCSGSSMSPCYGTKCSWQHSLTSGLYKSNRYHSKSVEEKNVHGIVYIRVRECLAKKKKISLWNMVCLSKLSNYWRNAWCLDDITWLASHRATQGINPLGLSGPQHPVAGRGRWLETRGFWLRWFSSATHHMRINYNYIIYIYMYYMYIYIYWY